MTARALFWLNVIGFQVVWMITVGGAAHDVWWAGPVAVCIFGAYQMTAPQPGRADPRLILLAVMLGFVADSLLVRLHLVVYASPFPSVDFAPMWILALWANLALTLNHSLTYLQQRPLTAALFGAIGAPLSYFFAARTWHAVTLAQPMATSLLVLAAMWAVATPVLARAALTLARRSTSDRAELRA